MKRTKILNLAIALVAGLVSLLVVSTVVAAISVTSETKLTASDAAAGDLFGRVSNSLGVSLDTVVVGAYLDDDADTSSGSAYIFEDDGTGWAEKAKLTASAAAAGDLFGQAVSIDGDAVVIGSFFDDDLGSHSGSAYVFRGSGSSWTQEAKFTASDGAEADQFGFSVSVSGDAALIGAPFNDDAGADSGSAYVFRWDGNSWSEEAKLTPSDGAAGDRFGDSVSISGNALVAGATFADVGGDETGVAYVFRWNGTAWNQEAKLTASDANKGDQFGFAVGISGDTAVVGAYGKGPGKNKGAAYVFKWDGTTWSEEAKITASDGAAHDQFGGSVSISGDIIVAGAPRGDDGSKDSGAAYVFERIGTTWTEEAKLNASDGAKDDFYGESVFIDGTTAIIGAPRNDDAGANSGSAYVYELSVT